MATFTVHLGFKTPNPDTKSTDWQYVHSAAPGSALLSCSAGKAPCNAAPLTAVNQELVMQRRVFFVGPSLPCDGRVEMPFPATHTLLIRPALHSV